MEHRFQLEQQLIHVSERMYQENVMEVLPSNFNLRDEKQVYVLLGELPNECIQFRLALLQIFNGMLIPLLPLLRLSSPHMHQFAPLSHTPKILHSSIGGANVEAGGFNLGGMAQLLRCMIFTHHKRLFLKKIMASMVKDSPTVTVQVNRFRSPRRPNTPNDSIDVGVSETSTQSTPKRNNIEDKPVFKQVLEQLHSLPPSSFLTAPRPFTVKLEGEHAIDAGGPFRDCLTDMCHELQTPIGAPPTLPLFISCPNAQLAANEVGIGNNREKYIPRPSAISPKEIKMYKFVGLMMGMAIRADNVLPLDFPSFVWKPLLETNCSLEDLSDIDQYSGHCLNLLKDNKDRVLTPSNFDEILSEMTFTTTLSDGSKIELKEDGKNIEVTFFNRLEYVELVEKARLNESKAQLSAMREGLGALVPLAPLSLLTWTELQTLVCGTPEIPIALLRAHSEYTGESKTLEMYFWEVMCEFTDYERSMFLRFAWGRERLPSPIDWPADQVLKIHQLYSTSQQDVTQLLPQASTCFFTIKIPNYSSVQVMKQKLLLAISHCLSIDTDLLFENVQTNNIMHEESQDYFDGD